MADTRKVGSERMKPLTRLETDYEMLKRLEREMEGRQNPRHGKSVQEKRAANPNEIRRPLKSNPFESGIDLPREMDASAKRKQRRSTIPTILSQD